MNTAFSAIFALALLLAAGGAQARITEIRIDAVEPFIDGHAFGTVGPYERLKGIAKGELDPNAREHAGIVDLDKAPRNSRGMVEYEVDIFILRPADPAKGSGILYYEVLNRGNKQLGTRLLDVTRRRGVARQRAQQSDHARACRQRLSCSSAATPWCGRPGIRTCRARNARMTARFPVAMENGKPMVRRIREEFQVGKRRPADVEVARLNYPAASTDQRQGAAVRARPPDRSAHRGPGRSVGVRRARIRCGCCRRARSSRPPRSTSCTTRRRSRRSSASALRRPATWCRSCATRRPTTRARANPLNAHGIRHALAFGGSQAGRFLRHYVELGMNKDLRGRKVFDGVYSHTAGAGKVFANHVFAEPDRTVTQHEDHHYPENWFPFSTAHTTDPFAGKTGSLLRGDGFDPLMIETNTSTEYWQKGASLLTMDPTGSRDLSLPANSRVYMIAGTQHGGRAGLGTRRGVCANPTNPHSAGAGDARAAGRARAVGDRRHRAAARAACRRIAAGTAVDDDGGEIPERSKA